MLRFFTFQSFLGVTTASLLAACGGGGGGGGGSSSAPPPSATHFSVTAPATTSIGTAFNVIVTALDASNSVVTGYSGTVIFTSTDGQAVLPANSMLAKGTATFSAKLNTANHETITATDTITASITGTSSSIQVVALRFQATGSMEAARVNHTATLLKGGEVLITGGSNDTGFILSSAELFNPASGSFTPAGGMRTARTYHTATLLKDGKVLITGGGGPTGFLSSAELFNPTTGSFTPTGSMTTARIYHTATLLDSGQVLVTGGIDSGIDNGGNPLASAELFNPNSGTFTAITHSMTSTRYFHSATLLSDGEVLIAGGDAQANTPCLATAELFDPTSGTFTATRNMKFPRIGHAVALLNDGKVLIAGGACSGPFVATVEVFDSVSGIFTLTGNMTTARTLHTATLLNDGMVLVAGGDILVVRPGCVAHCRLYQSVTASAELFNPITGTFVPTDPMTTARGSQRATLLTNGVVLITGGSSTKASALATAELYQ